jgi:hypothetical protein
VNVNPEGGGSQQVAQVRRKFAADTAAATGKTELRADAKTSLVTARRSVNNLGLFGL